MSFSKVVIYEAFVEGRLETPKHLARSVEQERNPADQAILEGHEFRRAAHADWIGADEVVGEDRVIPRSEFRANLQRLQRPKQALGRLQNLLFAGHFSHRPDEVNLGM